MPGFKVDQLDLRLNKKTRLALVNYKLKMHFGPCKVVKTTSCTWEAEAGRDLCKLEPSLVYTHSKF